MPPSGSYFGGPLKRVNGTLVSTDPIVAPNLRGTLPGSPAVRMPNHMTHANALLGFYVTNGGEVQELGGFGVTDYIPIPEPLATRQMLMTNDLAETFTSPGCYYDADKAYLSSIVSSAVYEGSPVYIVPEAAKFVRVVFRIDVPHYVGLASREAAERFPSSMVLSVLGDSIMTQFTGNLTSIPSLTSDILGLAAPVQNLAAGGLLITTNYGIATRCTQVLASATHVLIEGGVNDWGAGIPIGTIADNTRDTFYGACNYIADFFQTSRPYQKVIWLTPFRSGISIVNERTLEDYAAAIRAVCISRGIRCVDAYNELPINLATAVGARLYSWDALHPNDTGNAIIADFCAKEIIR